MMTCTRSVSDFRLYHAKVGDSVVSVFGPKELESGPELFDARVVRVSSHTAFVEPAGGCLVVAGNLSPVYNCRVAVYQASFEGPGIVVLDVEIGGAWKDCEVRDSDGQPIYLFWDGDRISRINRETAQGLGCTTRSF
jgi:hypothetical protein